MLIRYAFILAALVPVFGATPGYVDRLQKSAEVIEELMRAPDRAVPQDLLDRAECVVIIPGLKRAGFVFGGRYGRGFFFCRNDDGVGWRGPGAVRIEGFNFGLQIGGTEADILMLVMNRKGMERLLSSRFTVGGDMSAAAGPVGRTAEAKTDALLTAELLTYARSRGVFAGISLDGSTLREDPGVNRELYGEPLSNREVYEKSPPAPEVAHRVLELLNRYSSRKGR